jgi:TRAP-type mannitol/chloroaromatic compound transport system substrate-binding protein
VKKREFLQAGAVATAGLAIARPASAQATYNWKMATGWAGGPLMDIGAKAFAEKMDQLSGGRFKVQVFPGGALGNALKVPETVKNGVAECGHTWMGYDWGKDPTTVLFGGYAGSFDSERMLHWGRSDQAFEKSFVVHFARFRRHIHDRFRVFGSRDTRFGSGSRAFRCC